MYVSRTELIAGLAAGRVASFPTDTVPALAARPDQGAAIFVAKERSPDKPLILMGASWADLSPYVTGDESERAHWQALTQAHWPGALTLVLPASEQVPTVMHPKDPTTIGVRVPDLAIAREILVETGPLATTSANRSGEPPLETLMAIANAFPDVLVLSDLVAPIACIHGSSLPSTVAKWTADGWQILRQGSVQLSLKP
ncbi:MAG: L-threonylcarbamoyladenylate synthase [Spirulinaceae cyanobacterium SM2_1_0]|nr:L-threonylcarbamoyladenylate synthase [Spirulinaceae cyanobacterium SM2_1_0]